jgi:glucose/arabinose dehydrogenase
MNTGVFVPVLQRQRYLVRYASMTVTVVALPFRSVAVARKDTDSPAAGLSTDTVPSAVTGVFSHDWPPSQDTSTDSEPRFCPAAAPCTVTISAMLPTGLTDPCCLAELPSGDLLIGTREGGTIHRLDTSSGDVTAVGTLSGVAYEADRVLLALVVEPVSNDVIAYYTESDTATIARYGYDYEGELAYSAGTLVTDLPKPRSAAALAWGPDGDLYASTATGEILRMTSIGWEPDDNPTSGSFTYAAGHGSSITGLAWDEAGRLWAASAAEVNVVEPGGDVTGRPPLYAWPAAERVTGLAYGPGSGSLWLSSGSGTGNGGLWRIPLDGGVGLVAAPALFPLDESPVALLAARDGSGLWVLTAGGAVLKAVVS